MNFFSMPKADLTELTKSDPSHLEYHSDKQLIGKSTYEKLVNFLSKPKTELTKLTKVGEPS